MELWHIIKTHKGYFQLIENELWQRTYIPCEKPKKFKKEEKIKPQIKKITENFVNKICNNSTLKVWDIIKRNYYYNWKKEIQEQIVALKNNKRVLIDIPKWVF